MRRNSSIRVRKAEAGASIEVDDCDAHAPFRLKALACGIFLLPVIA
jgi:hypothetical protein